MVADTRAEEADVEPPAERNVRKKRSWKLRLPVVLSVVVGKICKRIEVSAPFLPERKTANHEVQV